jgi:pimeloyl-ACP methyl ester carboxylesterase
MSEVAHHGVKISYDTSGEGRPLILLHGWSCDRTWWVETGFTDRLQRDYRVINVDQRGHGGSDKPDEPSAYRAEEVVGDVLAVADAEGIDTFALWGYSYGGWVSWLTADSAPERVVAIVTTGSWDPRPESLDDDWEYFDAGLLEAIRRHGMQGLLDALLQSEGDAFWSQPPAWARAMILRGDAPALLAMRLGAGVSRLDDFPVPALLIAGTNEDESDEAAEVAGMIPDGERLRLPGLGHGDAGAASDLVLPAVREFLDRAFA